jgi:hypothetical protein
MLARQIRRLRPGLVLLQHPDDLIFREPRSLHLSVLQEARTLNPRGGKSQRQVSHLADQADHASQRSKIFNRLEKTFALGGFLSGRKSQLCQLRADTSVIRLICNPVDRTVDAEGFRPASVLVSHFLEDCWLPNEMCRAWLKQQKLEWPLFFEKTARGAGPSLETEPPLEEESQSRVGRPPLFQHYAPQFERVLEQGSLSPTLIKEAKRLRAWGRNNLDPKKHLSVGTLENSIRNRLKSWEGKVPWKTK